MFGMVSARIAPKQLIFRAMMLLPPRRRRALCAASRKGATVELCFVR